jgi:membrane protease YdiL (CAAX protease family)
MSKFKKGVTQEAKELRVTQVQRLSLDSLSFMFAIAATMISFLIFTQAVDTELTLAVKAAFMSIFVFGGILFSAIAVGSVNFKVLSPYGLLTTTIGTAVALLAIVAVVFVIPPASAVTLPDKVFYANMAIVETIFFCYFIFRWLCTLFPWPAAAVMAGLFFAPFHIGVYGWNPTFMAFAVIAMVIFCTVYYLSGSLFTAMGSHIIFNLLASAASITSPTPFVFGFALVPVLIAAVPLIKNEVMKNAKI